MTDSTSRSSAEHHQLRFVDRHIGPDADAVATMLGVIGVDSLEELAAKALPAGILDALSSAGLAPGLDELPAPASEEQSLAELRALAEKFPEQVSALLTGISTNPNVLMLLMIIAMCIIGMFCCRISTSDSSRTASFLPNSPLI